MRADFGKTASDYGRYRAGFPLSFFQRLESIGLVSGHESVVDLGTGTGTLARGLAARGCMVIGIDPSPDMLIQAKALADADGVQVTWKEARAEATGLEASSADVVAAGQCWHWFDGPKAIRETKRILRRGGRLVIAHFDWLPVSGNVVDRTEALIREANPEWAMGGGTGIHPRWLRHLSEGGFRQIESLSYDEDVLYSHEGWRGRIRASAGIGGSLSPDKVAAFDRRHGEVLTREFPDQPLVIPHRVFIVHGHYAGEADD